MLSRFDFPGILGMAHFLGIAGAALVIFVIACLLILAFEIWMFVDVILNKNISGGRKAIWIIGMLIIHPFVAIGYFFTDRHKAQQK